MVVLKRAQKQSLFLNTGINHNATRKLLQKTLGTPKKVLEVDRGNSHSTAFHKAII